MPKYLPSANPINMIIEYSSKNPTCATKTMQPDKPSSNLIPQPRSDPYAHKKNIQESLVS